MDNNWIAGSWEREKFLFELWCNARYFFVLGSCQSAHDLPWTNWHQETPWELQPWSYYQRKAVFMQDTPQTCSLCHCQYCYRYHWSYNYCKYLVETFNHKKDICINSYSPFFSTPGIPQLGKYCGWSWAVCCFCGFWYPLSWSTLNRSRACSCKPLNHLEKRHNKSR